MDIPLTGWLSLTHREGDVTVIRLPDGKEIFLQLTEHNKPADGVRIAFNAHPSIKIFREKAIEKRLKEIKKTLQK